MPVADSDYPVGRVAIAGETYSFPFNFSIPLYLLSQICSPRADEDIASNAHLLLPPSLGNRKVTSDGVEFKDDMAPEFTRITYYVRVTVNAPPQAGKEKVITEATRRIRLIPHFIDEPPFDVMNSKDDFVYTRIKKLKKGGLPFHKGDLGTLTVWANQPDPLRLPPAGEHHDQHLTGMTKVHIRFDPKDVSTKPPKLSNLLTKLKVHTFYSSRHLESFLNRRYPTAQGGKVGPWGKYVTTIDLPNRCVTAATQWRKHEPSTDPAYVPLETTLSRIPTRGSHISSSDEDSSDSDAEPAMKGRGNKATVRNYARENNGGTTESARSSLRPFEPFEPAPTNSTYYTCNIPSPFTFPADKTLLPTFASCHIARQYSLSLALNVHTVGALTQMLQVRLSVPLQISVAARKGTEGESRQLPEMMITTRDAELSSLLGPRGATMGGEGASTAPAGGTAGSLPPQYESAGFAGPIED